jgi:phosphatidylglycerophosphatase A
MKKSNSLMIATWFYSGLTPSPFKKKKMAGTYGSFFSLPLCYVALHLSSINHNLLPLIIILIIIYLLGIITIPTAEKELGPIKDYKGKIKDRDQNEIVIDEVAGMLIACAPIYFFNFSFWWTSLIAFGLFRLFDIRKYWPIKFFDRQKTANGVMLDDVIAGIYSALVLYIILSLTQALLDLIKTA